MEHVLNAGPSALVLTEGGALCETLVMLGHESDARTLQATLTGWAAAHKVSTLLMVPCGLHLCCPLVT